MSTMVFDQHLFEVLLSDLSAHPTWLVKSFRESFKLRSKSLHRVLASVHTVRLMRVQEAIAQALGFANTHDLQEAISSIREIVNEHDISNQRRWVEENRQSLSKFLPVYRLKGQNLAHEMDQAEASSFLKTLTINLAEQLDLPTTEVGAAIRKAWSGSGAGPDGQLFGPNPLTFGIRDWSVFGGRVGRFDLDADAALYLNDLLEEDEGVDVGALDPLEREEMGIYWLEVARSHPYFLDAFLRAADFIEDERAVRALLSEGITYAERVIPKGYRGPILYAEIGNRPYIRALERRMRSYLMPPGVNFVKALADASKIDRRSTLKEVRPYRMKCLLQALVKGDTPATRAGIEKTLRLPDSSSLLIGGVSRLLIGDDTGLEQVVAACIWAEGMHRILEASDPVEESSALDAMDSWTDSQNLLPLVMVVLNSRPPLRKMLSVALRGPMVAGTRYKLSPAYYDEGRPLELSLSHAIQEHAREISRLLLLRNPLPKNDASH